MHRFPSPTPRIARLVLVLAVALLELALTRAAHAQGPAQSAASPATPEAPRSAPAFVTGLEGRTPTRPARGERVSLNLEDGDLMDLVRLMTSITGHRYVLTGSPRAVRATIASTEPVTVEEATLAFHAILHQNGLTVVRRGRHHLIVDAGGVARRSTEVFDDARRPPVDDRFVTWIHRVTHAPVDEIAALLEPLRSTEGQILTHAPTSSLIVVETGANIARMRRILRDIDVPGGDVHLWVEPLRFADAQAIAEHVRAVFLDDSEPAAAPARRTSERPSARAEATPAPSAATSTPPAAALRRVLFDARINALIVVGTEAGYRRVLALVRELDRPDDETTVRVHRLQHADAGNVAQTLQRLLGGGAEGQGAARPDARIRVEPHADLNALVITASPAEQRRVRQLVTELDTAPRQVFLEMVLMELTVERGQGLGVNVLSGLQGVFDSSLMGFISGGAPVDAADLLTGIAIGVSGPTVRDPRLPGGSAPSFGAVLHALSRSTQADILSTPHVLVLDNREATINVGQNVPLQGSSVPGFPALLPGAGTGSTDASGLQALLGAQGGGRRDTGTIVRVTPHINDDGEIRLEIEAEDSRQGEVAQGNLGAVALNQSIAQTELVVRDGQTAVIGGLIRDSSETVRTGVPVLSDIPLLGALFSQTQERTVRRNLLFFVTPYVVRSQDDLRRIFERRMRERREMAERQRVFEGPWEPHVDYTRTRGGLAEMLDRVAALEREEAEAALAAAMPSEVHPPRPPLDLEGEEPAREEGEEAEIAE
jgi:general secretion pathway protein D